MEFKVGDYVCMNPRNDQGFNTNVVGIVMETPVPYWGDCYTPVAWPGLNGAYKTVFPVLTQHLLLV